jgi:hypothetical protein
VTYLQPEIKNLGWGISDCARQLDGVREADHLCRISTLPRFQRRSASADSYSLTENRLLVCL